MINIFIATRLQFPLRTVQGSCTIWRKPSAACSEVKRRQNTLNSYCLTSFHALKFGSCTYAHHSSLESRAICPSFLVSKRSVQNADHADCRLQTADRADCADRAAAVKSQLSERRLLLVNRYWWSLRSQPI